MAATWRKARQQGLAGEKAQRIPGAPQAGALHAWAISWAIAQSLVGPGSPPSRFLVTHSQRRRDHGRP